MLRLASLIMPPRVNLVRFHGVFAPASPLRSRVVPKPVNVPVETIAVDPLEDLDQAGVRSHRRPVPGVRVTDEAPMKVPP